MGLLIISGLEEIATSFRVRDGLCCVWYTVWRLCGVRGEMVAGWRRGVAAGEKEKRPANPSRPGTEK